MSKYPPKPTGHRFIDVEGQKFNRLFVLGFAGYRKGKVFWECRCDCGTIKEIDSSNLRSGSIKSCGCWLLEFTANLNRSHGQTKTPEYRAFLNARTRCNNPNREQYKDYGGRGIEFHFDSFEEFLAEVGPKPSPKHSIDRIDNDGHYEKGNVQWAIKKTQARNQRKSRSISANGLTLNLSEWAERSGIGESLIRARLDRLGWCSSCSVSIQTGRGKRAARCPHI